MLDNRLRALATPLLEAIATPLARLPFSANHISYGGFVLGMLGCLAIALQYYMWGMVFILLNRIFDVLDGLLARQQGITDFGGYLDIVLDFFFYASVPVAFSIAATNNNPAAAILVLSFVGTGTSFLAYAIICAKRGINPDEKKSFYYLRGLTESTETTLFFCAFCLFPQFFSPLAYIFSALCVLTFAMRVWTAAEEFAQ